MNIQPVAASIAPRVDERQGQAQAVGAAGGVSAVAGQRAGGAAEPSHEEVSAAVKKINDAMTASAQSLEFSIDEDTKDIVVKVIDQGTKEVVRQIPSKEALEIAKALDKTRGLLLNQTA